VRFAVVSDIQGNLQALEAVLAEIDTRHQHIDRIVCAGDVVGLGPNPNEVIQLMRSRDIDTARGNYDDALAAGRTESGTDFSNVAAENDDAAALAWTRESLTAENQSYLEGLPRTLRLVAGGTGVKVSGSNLDERTEEFRRTYFVRALFGGMFRHPVSASKRVTVLHGSTRALNEFVREDTANSILQAIARDADTDVFISGHPGAEFRREAFGVAFIGVGPVSDVRRGNALGRYAVITTGKEVEVEFGSSHYEPAPFLQALRASGLPDSLAAPFYAAQV
jgi:predicted phosphodiesterase